MSGNRHLPGCPCRFCQRAAGRQHEPDCTCCACQPPVGSKHHKARFTEAEVLAIRASTENNRALAERYGVGISAISQIRSRIRWKHV